MIDTATNWFYGERRLSAGAAIENLRHELWAWGYYNVWLRLVRSEPPYLASGLYNGEKFEMEFEPRQYAHPPRRQRERLAAKGLHNPRLLPT